MAQIGGFQPFKQKSAIKTKKRTKRTKAPVSVFRFRLSGGEYCIAEKYVFVSRRRLPEYDVRRCVDQNTPAKYVKNPVGAHLYDVNPTYEVEMLKYGLNDGDMNEYELRDLTMSYVKSKMKKVDKVTLQNACAVFDKADKMLSRADLRKNSNTNEANVSYAFMCKSYSKILTLLK